MLGAGLVLSGTRMRSLGGLLAFALASAVQLEAAAVALPLIALLLANGSDVRPADGTRSEQASVRPADKRLRCPIAIAAWVAVVLVARGANAVLLDAPRPAVVESAEPAFQRAMRWDVEGSAAYVWFTDVQNPVSSARRIRHDGSPSTIQRGLHRVMLWLGETPLFAPWLYLVLACGLLAAVVRERALLAVTASGLVGTAAVYVTDRTEARSVFWLIAATMLVALVALARRVAGRHSPPP
jgi:hypothetical protein